jgi:rubrerythrin
MKADQSVTRKQVNDLMYQALETEIGGVEIYRMAVLCANNEDLKEEWLKYLAQTERHVEIVRGVFDVLGLDPEATTPGRQIVRDKAKSLLSAMQKALKDAPQAAQIVAAECVVDAETKDHLNWQLIGSLAERSSGKAKQALTDAYESVQEQEAEHLFHSKGWCRELWLESLGLPAVLPPEEEERDVKTATEAGRAQDARKPEPKKKSGRR